MPDTPRPLLELFVRFPANGHGLDAFHAVLDRLLQDAVTAGHPIPNADAIALRTAIGEIIANIVEHACAGSTGAKVSMGLARFPDRIEATFEDPGAPFDPDMTTTPDALPQGGIGLSVVRASMDVLDYTRVGSTNHWRLVRQFQGRRR